MGTTARVLALPLAAAAALGGLERGLARSRSNFLRHVRLSHRSLTSPRAQEIDGDLGVPSVAVIGGGVAGLMCAIRLRELGVKSVIFDTGKRGPGGRASSRKFEFSDSEDKFSFTADHACQFFTAQTPTFKRFVQRWENEGYVKRCFENPSDLSLIDLTDSEISHEKPTARVPRLSQESLGIPGFVGVGGMGALWERLGESLEIHTDTWVASARRHDGTWRLFKDSRGEKELCPEREFSAIVISHCGKCAERLMRNANAPAPHRILRARFGPKQPSPHILQIQSVFVLVAAVRESEIRSRMTFQGAFLEGDPTLSWVCDNTQKHDEVLGPYRVLTLISTPEYAAKNKVPQEAIPVKKEREITADMLQALHRLLPDDSRDSTLESRDSDDSKTENLQAISTRLQLWGAALPSNIYKDPCVLDPVSSVGICGDWMVAPSVEGAALSGLALANALGEFLTCPPEERKSIGIYPPDGEGVFVPLQELVQGKGKMTQFPPIGAFSTEWLPSLQRAERGGDWQEAGIASEIFRKIRQDNVVRSDNLKSSKKQSYYKGKQSRHQDGISSRQLNRGSGPRSRGRSQTAGRRGHVSGRGRNACEVD